MKKWWRPVVLGLLLGAAFDGLAVYTASARGTPVDPTVLAGIPITMLFLVGIFVARAYRAPGQFVAGLREGGAEPEILEDRINWFCDRRIRARTAQGEWQIESGGGRILRLYVRAPGRKDPTVVTRDFQKAGSEAARRRRS